MTDLLAGDRAIRTIAIESTDQSAVRRAVQEMGLNGYLNANYAVGLRAVLDHRPERYAVVDAGTNSIKFRIAERTPNGWRTLTDRAEITRLGEGLTEGGDITPPAVTRTADAIARMADEATEAGVLAIVAVGTAGLRAARNAGTVVDAIRERTGVDIEVIPGDEESRLAYQAVRDDIDVAPGTVVVFDTGGGSSQFTFGNGTGVNERFSVPVGAVRYTEAFGLADAVSPATLDQAVAAIGAALDRLDGRTRPDVVVGIGGAVTNMAAVKHALDTIRPRCRARDCARSRGADRQIEAYRTRDADDRRTIVGLQPKRADVILAGACIVRTVLDKLDVKSLTVSDRGLRDGVLIERFGA